jgi:hypothetical protein
MPILPSSRFLQFNSSIYLNNTSLIEKYYSYITLRTLFPIGM